MIGKFGYKGYVGLEYEDNDAAKEVPRQAANLCALLRMVSA